MTLNFNDLPCDIKKMIFKINKDRDRSEKIKNHKLKFKNVLSLICDNKIYYDDDDAVGIDVYFDDYYSDNPLIFYELEYKLTVNFINSLYDNKNIYFKYNNDIYDLLNNYYDPYYISLSEDDVKGIKIC